MNRGCRCGQYCTSSHCMEVKPFVPSRHLLLVTSFILSLRISKQEVQLAHVVLIHLVPCSVVSSAVTTSIDGSSYNRSTFLLLPIGWQVENMKSKRRPTVERLGSDANRDLWRFWCVAQPITVEATWATGFTGVVSVQGKHGHEWL